MHGLTRNGRDFDRLANRLQEKGSVFCPDIVGRGRSDRLTDPVLYGYQQYCADMTALLARIDAPYIDWIGTSMGGIIGMLLASQTRTPIRRLVLNDVGPLIPLTALKRIGDYVGRVVEFNDMASVEDYLRTLYASFGITRDDDWRHLAEHGAERQPNGKFVLTYDLGIAKNFSVLDKDADLWSFYDRIQCPTLILRGANSDILPKSVADEMTRRGPGAKLIEIAGAGHAPALMDSQQIDEIGCFLSD